MQVKNIEEEIINILVELKELEIEYLEFIQLADGPTKEEAGNILISLEDKTDVIHYLKHKWETKTISDLDMILELQRMERKIDKM